jgi:ubiquinone/menaquinone biosynthesis C-methylase UbiE
MTDRFGGDKTKAYEAAAKAQVLAFAPAFFQAVITLRDKGVLSFLNTDDEGHDEEEIAKICGLNSYAARILLEAGEAAGVLIFDDDKYWLSKTGYLLISDEVTRRNMNFMNDVCYRGLFYLSDSIKSKKPVGLKVFGDWDTIYEGLSQLPEPVKKSWFEFDHYYSDAAFGEALKIIFSDGASKRILDVGGNTGRFAIKCARCYSGARITILDHEGQLAIAKQNAEALGLHRQIDGVALNLLDHNKPFPTGYDAVWMSQFLDCFPPKDIIQLLSRGREALRKNGYLYVMEPFVNAQRHPQAKLALVGTSLYFTALANGTSRMYHWEEIVRYAEEAGLKPAGRHDGIGEFQTILIFERE